MSAKIVIYLEDHTVRYSIIPDISRRLNLKKPICVLVESGSNSLETETLKRAARDAAAKKRQPFAYYQEIAARSKNFWPENFKRELQTIIYLAGALPTIELLDIAGIDPRTGNIDYDYFVRNNRVFNKLLACKGELLQKSFLEEQAFMAWFANRIVIEKEWSDYEQFLLCVGHLHFASFLRYLGATRHEMQFLRLPDKNDQFLRLINPKDKKSVMNYLANGDENSDAWKLYKFFIN